MLTELQPFIGRFHPLLVHLPIGFLLLAGVVEVLSRLKRFEDAGISRLMPTLLALCVLSTGGAIVTGTLLSWSGEYDAGARRPAPAVGPDARHDRRPRVCRGVVA